MTDKPKPFQAWTDYSEMAHKWRGYVINHAIDLEQVMEIFISKHYIIGVNDEDYNQKLEDFKKVFFWETSMGFGNKIKITNSLITIYQPDFFQLEHTQNVSQELEDIIKCRNAMAHWQLDFSKEYRWNGAHNKNIKVNKIKSGSDNIYSEVDINRIVELCRKYTTIFLHWSSFPNEIALPNIFYSTEERLSKLTDAERAQLRKEYKTDFNPS